MSTIREYNEWIQMRWMEEEAGIARPHVLLIGDSIVCGHGVELHETIKDRYIVDYFGTSKIVCDVDYRSDLEFMLRRKKYALIIFNNGLHGGPVSDDEYVSGLTEIIALLKQYAPVVWRNSTPCYTLNPESPNPFVDRVPVRNALAEKVMKQADVPILDAYSLLKDKPELSTDGWHFIREGYQILIDAEKALIEKMLK